MAYASGIMEEVISHKVRKASYMVPSMYDSDDIAQEMRIACWKGLEKFDTSRVEDHAVSGVIRVFMRRCIDHRIYNLRRSVYLPNNPPCNRCQYWQNKECAIYEYDCERIQNYRDTLKRRQRLDKPAAYKGQGEKFSDGDSQASDLSMAIEERLESSSLVLKYRRLIAGHTIDNESLEKIRAVTKEVLENG